MDIQATSRTAGTGDGISLFLRPTLAIYGHPPPTGAPSRHCYEATTGSSKQGRPRFSDVVAAVPFPGTLQELLSPMLVIALAGGQSSLK